MSRVSRMRRASGLVVVLALMVGGFVGVGGPTAAVDPVSADETGSGVTSIDVGSSHTCVLGADRSAWCWGDNYYGQLGDGTRVDSDVPVRVDTGDVERWRSVSTGAVASCGVAEDGSAWCWGSNSAGQLGDGTRDNSPVPVQVHTGDVQKWRSISPARTRALHIEHTCGVAEDGSAWCWGRNFAGQLGDGTSDASEVPVRVDAGGVERWRSVATGAGFSCGVAEDGSGWCWGYNDHGQLGDGTWVDSDVPVRVHTDDVERWQSVNVAFDYACGVAEDGSAWCWGSNSAGQLGDGTRDDSPVPTQVDTGDVDTWRSLVGFSTSTCGVAEDGSAWCWGSNADGALGDGTNDASEVPVRVNTGDVERWRSVAAGNAYSCGVAEDGSAWCWGRNGDGQPGDGSAVPAAVVKPEPEIVLDGVPGAMTHGQTALLSVSVDLAVGVSVSTDGACSAVEDDDGDFVLSASGTGPCAVTAETFDNGILMVSSVTETTQVSPAVAAVSVDDVSVVYDGGPQPVEVVTDPVGLAVEVTYDGAAAVPVDAGTYAVEAVVVEEGYAGSATAVLTIDKAAQQIDLAGVPGSMAFGDSVTIDVEADSGLPVAVSASGVCALDGFALSATGVGQCVVEATQAGDGNFEPAESVIVTVEVSPAVAAVSVDDVSVVYDGGPQPVEVVTDPVGLAVEVTYDGAAAVPVDAGTYAVEAVVVEEGYAGSATAVLTIEPAATDVEVEVDGSVAVGESVLVEVVVSTGSGDVPTGEISIVGADGGELVVAVLDDAGAATVALDDLGVGTHELTAAYDGDRNHGPATAVAPVEVVTAPLSLTGLPTAVDPGDTVEVTATGFLPGEEVVFVVHSDPVAVATGVADGHGTVTVDFAVPDLPGVHRLVATGASSGLAVEAETVIADTTPDVPGPGTDPQAPTPVREVDPPDQTPAPDVGPQDAGTAPGRQARGSESVTPAGQLPVTGWPASPTVGVALLALAAGAVLIATGRRRRHA